MNSKSFSADMPDNAADMPNNLAAITQAELARLGFINPQKAKQLLADPELQVLNQAALALIASAPDPDLALIAALRLFEAAGRKQVKPQLTSELSSEAKARMLFNLLGGSAVLGDFLARHPELIGEIQAAASKEPEPRKFKYQLLKAVGAIGKSFEDYEAQAKQQQAASETFKPYVAGEFDTEGRTSLAYQDALKIKYFELLCVIAMRDLSHPDPSEIQARASAELSFLADGALEAALAIARSETAGHEEVRLSIIAMGKNGGRELNYISDVDVLYVVKGLNERDTTELGSELAKKVAAICARRTAEGALWQLDANLRPEGRDGQLVRTLESYREYYRKWAHTWEFQALLKARAAAGDLALGAEFVQLTWPLVWQASSREGFVEDTRAMRRRVVELVEKSQGKRNLKLGSGGLRDVEFTIQLLQMVHGRADESIRAQSTLDALAKLTAGGYISREQAKEMESAYRFLRTVEHRIQLTKLKPTQVLPESEQALRVLARSLNLKPSQMLKQLNQYQLRVRQLHEEIYYRPLLATSARLSDGEISLSPDAQQARLAAIGYLDGAKAVRHIAALTSGLSRTSAIQRQLLPSMLEWFSEGTDPDLGLLAFRRLSEKLGSTHWYLGLLRDSGVAAKRLTKILSCSKYVGEQLERMPVAVRWLARDESLIPPKPEVLQAEIETTLGRSTEESEVVKALSEVRDREITRLAIAQIIGLIDASALARALTELADVIIKTTLDYVQLKLEGEVAEGRAKLDFAIIAMGSYGAIEMGYSSDADLQFVISPNPAVAIEGQLDAAGQVATLVQKSLNSPAAGINMKLNAELRPEGKMGPLVRSFDSLKEYYLNFAKPWEKQALLRARVISGSEAFKAELTEFLDLIRYPKEGLDPKWQIELRKMKARIEAERLPRGADANRHLKLGRGATTDVEWVAQYYLLQYGGKNTKLRQVNTLAAINSLKQAGIISPVDAQDLIQAWELAWSIRRALFLWRGKENQVLPTDIVELNAIAALVKFEVSSAKEIEEIYLKFTRRARAIMERVIFAQ